MLEKKISVIIVSYNVSSYLERCIKSVYDTENFSDLEIVIVDNNSSDESVSIIKNNFPECMLIENNRNLGFSKAVNIGISKSKADYICILNPDTLVKKNTFSELYYFLSVSPNTGVAGAKILNPDGSFQVSSRRNFPTIPGLAYKYIGLSRLFPMSKVFGYYNHTYIDSDQGHKTDSVSGACMMFKRKLVDVIGNFDENFFMYFEDTDYCIRAASVGYDVFFNPKAQIVHYGGKSWEKSNLDSSEVFYSSAKLFFYKYKQRLRYRNLSILMLRAGFFIRKKMSILY